MKIKYSNGHAMSHQPNLTAEQVVKLVARFRAAGLNPTEVQFTEAEDIRFGHPSSVEGVPVTVLTGWANRVVNTQLPANCAMVNGQMLRFKQD